MNDSVVFVRRSSGGGCYALILVLALFPVMGLLHAVLDDDEKNVGAAVVFGLVALAFLVGKRCAMNTGSSSTLAASGSSNVRRGSA